MKCGSCSYVQYRDLDPQLFILSLGDRGKALVVLNIETEHEEGTEEKKVNAKAKRRKQALLSSACAKGF